MEFTPDKIQNELIIISHHVEDALKGIGEGDFDYVKKSLLDIMEVVDRLKKDLPSNLSHEIDRIAGDLND